MKETPAPSGTARPAKAPARFAVRWALGLALLVATTAGWFALAGRTDWVQGWIFAVSFAVFGNGLGLWLRKTDPGLLEERSRPAANAEPWDRWVIRAHTLLFLALLVVAALDAGRYRWSRVPIPVQVAAGLGVVTAGTIIGHVFRVNRFLSSHARIQDDRGQMVVSRGLYGVVRHPMYVAVMLWALLLPPALGSLWALVPGVLTVVLFIYRTAREDRMLQERLAGYPEYATRVRYRLLPGVW
jgi:protein-S-isoprenylcysteine O-methyltransferase Ste14